MAFGNALLLFPVFVLVTVPVISVPNGSALDLESQISRSSFPTGFIFGTSSSAYQFEGAVREGGRGASIWDTFTHNHPEKIVDRTNGDIADDQYHRYKEDVKLMKDIGFNAYRLSISWGRILPNGSLSGGINQEGVSYYNNLINELISHGVQPFVSLSHLEYPQALDDQYGGFLSPRIVDDFLIYSEICFKEFGDRVKYWMTFNEPSVFCFRGYSTGEGAPGRCSPWEGNCTAGDSAREPYKVGHYLLLAHAAVVKLYREKYQEIQKGKIGIALISNWYLPYSDTKLDKDAVNRYLDFMYGWFMDPLTNGTYPLSMQKLVGKRLPKFTKKQSQMLKSSYDFIGLNYYTSSYAISLPYSNNINKSYSSDTHVKLTGIRNGVPIGPETGIETYHVYPQGLREVLLYTKKRYNNPTIYITENGMGEHSNKTAHYEESRMDNKRINFFKGHLLYIQRAIREGVDVKGYFVWALIDNFEWASGYTVRFGMNFVDYNNGLKRSPKTSALWFKKFLKK